MHEKSGYSPTIIGEVLRRGQKLKSSPKETQTRFVGRRIVHFTRIVKVFPNKGGSFP